MRVFAWLAVCTLRTRRASTPVLRGSWCRGNGCASFSGRCEGVPRRFSGCVTRPWAQHGSPEPRLRVPGDATWQNSPPDSGTTAGRQALHARRRTMRGCMTHMATDYDSPRKTDDELTE